MCPESAVAHGHADKDGYFREHCEIPSGKKDCRYYAGSCTVPGTSHGPWRRYYPNGQLAEAGANRNGFADGDNSTWYPSGQPREQFFWDGNGGRVGLVTRWFENGQIAQRGQFAHNRPSGAWQAFYPHGQRAWQGTYDDGRPTGDWTFFNPDGTVSLAITLALAAPRPFWTWGPQACPDGGQLYGEGPETYKRQPGDYGAHSAGCYIVGPSSSLPHGPSVTWNGNELITQQVTNDHGLRHGLWISLDAWGAPTLVEHYQHGQLHGERLTFGPEGVLVKLVRYVQGQVLDEWQSPAPVWPPR